MMIYLMRRKLKISLESKKFGQGSINHLSQSKIKIEFKMAKLSVSFVSFFDTTTKNNKSQQNSCRLSSFKFFLML